MMLSCWRLWAGRSLIQQVHLFILYDLLQLKFLKIASVILYPAHTHRESPNHLMMCQWEGGGPGPGLLQRSNFDLKERVAEGRCWC